MNYSIILKVFKVSVTMLLLWVVGVGKVNAQDPEFTQFYANPLYLNPAFAGTNMCPRVAINYRNQWPSLSGTFVTYSASYDQHVNVLHGGLGFIVVHDQAAKTLSSTRASGIYSYQLPVTRKFSIRFGLEAAFFQKRLDWNKLTFGDMIDPRRGFVYQTGDVPRGGSVSNIDVSAGIVGFSKVVYFGVAAHHLNEPNESLLNGKDTKLPMKITAHAGAMIPIDGAGSKYNKKAPYISPNLLFRMQGTFTQLNMGLYLKKGAFTAGIWYRNRDAFIVSFGMQTEVFKVGYSYDVTVSKLTPTSGGSHEVSLGFDFPCRPKKKTFRVISCPSF